ncbi:hypothetical protein SCHPADRAFT_896389 [Schizopora paradoxa]|uniref:Uncharacterized protein n=1 Tax=Schizopora paradoxa TaxID=27342 RepID=A0A0H2R1R6_9AGAM|nr:hypothetical protein SCHPADRAFT_896389 [Schizopora paradoxa]
MSVMGVGAQSAEALKSRKMRGNDASARKRCGATLGEKERWVIGGLMSLKELGGGWNEDDGEDASMDTLFRCGEGRSLHVEVCQSMTSGYAATCRTQMRLIWSLLPCRLDGVSVERRGEGRMVHGEAEAGGDVEVREAEDATGSGRGCALCAVGSAQPSLGRWNSKASQMSAWADAAPAGLGFTESSWRKDN